MQTAFPLCNAQHIALKSVGKLCVKLKFRNVKGNLETKKDATVPQKYVIEFWKHL